ncbi:protoporphyrinogen oxidase [Rhodobacteraceae bacterium 2CG4]|uniref:Protoporphyrinogen oxidase n=1 Tax=Halovulum marinum TaxID=2662447 RepID=A0A6L5Z080_9RHOB|nr:flavodoxin domain-containing protein [Halovulum marinum]MSU89520.1 protoporphyrinogen oxidase [Halovulum marinum]
MKILIYYATVEGQTGKIARFAAASVARAGHRPVLAAAAADRAIPLGGIDAAILAAPVHERRHPPEFETRLRAQARGLIRIPTLMLSVSLSAAFPEGLEAAEDYLLEMKMRTGLAPDREALVAGAVRASSYDYYQSKVVNHVVLRDRDPVPAGADREFTDWPALAATVAAFCDGLQAGVPVPGITDAS